jgi:prepilin-type processing-associated H-X9-DG protein
MSDERRPWFTLTELAVVVFISFLLAALLFPSVSTPRSVTRKAACSNNLRQLAMAHLETATRHPAGEFGGYLVPQRLVDGSPVPDDDPSTPTPELWVAWPTKLLPALESQTLYEQILSGDKSLDLNAPPQIDVLVCPSDASVDPTAASLSYVVNSGMPDLASASDTQPSDLAANGVCHDQRPGRFGPTVSLRDIKDGQSHTILLSENIHRDPAGSARQPGNTWLRPAPNAANPEQWYGMVWLVDPQDPRSPRAELTDRFNRDSRTGAELDQSYATSGTRFARPSSNHPGVFNVAFCGGNVKEIDEDIDYAVYQQLMTPNGAKAAPADAPDKRFEKTLPDDQRFMNPPLADDDF